MTRRVGLSGVLRLRVAYLSVSEGEVLGSEERRSNSCAFVGTFVFDREIYELTIMLDAHKNRIGPLSKHFIPISNNVTDTETRPNREMFSRTFLYSRYFVMAIYCARHPSSRERSRGAIRAS